MKKQNKYVISYTMCINADMTANASLIREHLSEIKTYKITGEGSRICVTSEEQDRRATSCGSAARRKELRCSHT